MTPGPPAGKALEVDAVSKAYAIPILKDLKASYQHKTGVKDVVRMFLERKTFAVPAGMPISFDKVIEAGDARIALGKPRRRRPAFLSVSGFFPFGRSRDRRADGPV